MSTTAVETDASPNTNPTEKLDSKAEIMATAKTLSERVKQDYITLNAAGVAFYAFLAMIPTLVALVTIYGLVADPNAIEERVEDLSSTLPDEVRTLLVGQLESITSTASGALTLSLVVSLGFALWSASSGMANFMGALNLAYGGGPPRPFLARRLLALAFTLGGLVFAVVAIGAITALPAVLSSLGVTGPTRWLLTLAAWPVVGLGLLVALAVLYRFAPNRGYTPPWRWVSPGAVVATVAWLVASIGFQIYVANFGSYNETYGSLGAIVVLLLWLWISALVIIVGGLLNHILEGEPEPDPADEDRADR